MENWEKKIKEALDNSAVIIDHYKTENEALKAENSALKNPKKKELAKDEVSPEMKAFIEDRKKNVAERERLAKQNNSAFGNR
ncbi:hypothetical protein [Mucilaginibacter paludis]|uniref:Uncharacterized protein n=1 Tax=Mucilaginibacter paludis DSM 18603 TaxID=714943 RepID=H1Y7B8_9SPHI|nr:hypothetical protein [Mucilaginibacter paludis]EHQ29005.1 hypothetical protein Mucpa_4921 [Mucilaginibacter paludis DSM 18603]